MLSRAIVRLAILSFAIVTGAAIDVSADTSGALADAGDGDRTSWMLQGRDGGGLHFSPLNEITDRNVGRLGLQWAVDLPVKDGFVGTPLVADGVVYQSGTFSRIVANDVRTGALLWKFEPTIAFTGATERSYGLVNRGVAIWGGNVYVNTGDCHLVAVDRKTGRQAWKADVCTDSPHLTLTAMPHVGAGKIFVGTSNIDFGTSRCHVSAFDAATGRKLWRFYTYPGDPRQDARSADPAAMRMAAKTWGKGYEPVGGCPWNSMRYDEKLDLLFVGTGGPTSFSPSLRGTGRGLELFSNAIIALKPSTGKLVWYYQVTPNDAVNYEAVQSIVVTDLEIGGKKRRVILQAPKNGFFFVLDAKTGKFISARNYVPVNWTTGIDPKSGKFAPWNPDVQYWMLPERRARLLPSGMGAHNVQPMSFSPQSGLAYIPAIELEHDYKLADEGDYGGVKVNLSVHAKSGKVPLIAWDPISQSERWRVDRSFPMTSGVLSTAGNLVFQGLGTGRLEAYNAASGSLLWSYDTGAAIAAAPITVEVDGRQVLLVSVGNGGSTMMPHGWRALWNAPARNGTPRLLAFALDAKAPLPPIPPVDPIRQPTAQRPTPEQVGHGERLFDLNCAMCHGQQVLGMRGEIPDLRRSLIPATPEAFAVVVKDGVLKGRGMPLFDFSDAEREQLRSYILLQTWRSFDAQQRGAELQPEWQAEW